MAVVWPGDGPDSGTWAGGGAPVRMLVAFAASTGNGDMSLGPLTVGTWRLFADLQAPDRGQFPGPGPGARLTMYARSLVPGETGANVISVRNPSGSSIGSNGVGVWVYELANIDSGWPFNIRYTADAFNLNPALSPFTLSCPTINAATPSVLAACVGYQKVNYGQVTQATLTAGTALSTPFMQNIAGADLNAGVCGTTGDASTPDVWLAYTTGTGVTSLSVGGTITCSGAVPDYNMSDLTRFGLMLPTRGVFSIVQQAHAYTGIAGGYATASLPGAP